MDKLVPRRLTKLGLIDNNLKDNEMQELFESMSSLEEGGIQNFTFAENTIGKKTVKAISAKYFCSKAAGDLKKFVLK